MSFFGNKRLIIVLVGLVLLISVVGFTSRERVKLTWPEMFFKDTFSVVQGFFYRPAQAVSGFFQEVDDAYNVYEENKALKAGLDQYARMSAELLDLQAENTRLREALQAKESLKSYQLRFAEVVARNPDTWNNVITIDKGLKQGIRKDMAVITSKGLIGRVQSVANFSSSVELLTSYERRDHISAVVQTTQVVNGQTTVHPVSGVVEEYDPQERLLIMRKIPWGQKIEAKQQVITSGLGGVVPRNLPIGYIVRVEPDDYGLTQTAYIQPSADFSQLNEVMIVERNFSISPTGELIPQQNAGQITNVPNQGTSTSQVGGGQ
ncbi:rod shape-determining protein MreC [Brevibacillus centrosporus]|uniref:Cell shape-determining protein MreC n=1 Tax=Brevibacillus centrosporus TaxID=54910 RepID=A0A1I3WPZ8_9BACL|nr:rod shape-determining protein MreC [Brevibacillus centrosporus]MEC2131130.1 rod shape-determining protein MreC [Brevibacillus centrosporus]MED4911756.1 rod shape-determining protein MreC [Brevibacillus centrosporus]RNB72979.1 rod shape-determining protein MreC [Brevibacillus centrosporus]SFK09440.1 rod shape-determining protein MreC [Brevibacillus centrosporus]GED31794.1 cell shape-determining protein MreC [Brevibacillus centrosporus]